MSSNPLTPSFRKLHVIPPDAAHDSVRKALRDNDKSITDLNLAIQSLKSQIVASVAPTTPAAATTVNESVQVNNWAGLGTINNESGSVSYSTQQSDDGALIIFSDAAPVAVSLGVTVTTPWFCFVQNWGAGLVTFTPASGTINYIGNLAAATMTLAQGYSCMIVFDGIDFWAETLPIVPQSFAAMAGKYLTGYNATTGLFSAASVPCATDSTSGLVKVDGVTIGIDSTCTIYTQVMADSTSPSTPYGGPGNPFFFDSSASPWHGYVWFAGNWQRFS